MDLDHAQRQRWVQEVADQLGHPEEAR